MPKPGLEELEKPPRGGAPLEGDEEDGNQPGAEIEVPEEGAPAKGAEINPDEIAEEQQAFKTLDNKAFALMRKKAKELERKNAELNAQLEKAKQPVQAAEQYPQQTQFPQQQMQRPTRFINGQRLVVPESKAEWDDLAKRDWQTAVDLKSIINAETIQQQSRQVDSHARQLEEAKQSVLKKHPELNGTADPKSQIYLQVLREHPEYLNMPRGPIYAMRDMEERMEQQGLTPSAVDAAKKAGAAEESARQSRVAVSSSGGKIDATPANSRSVTLTKDELEFCTNHNLKPEAYAKRKLERMSKKGA